MLIYIIFFIVCNSAVSQIYINEVSYTNRGSFTDGFGDTPDWIEIYNAGNEGVNLNRWGLSDNPDRLAKWLFPDTVISPGSFIIVFASGSDKSAGLQADFKLKNMEEPVILTKPDGTIADSLNPLCIPADKSAGRIPDGAPGWSVFMEPSAGGSNNNSQILELNFRRDILSVDQEGGFFDSPVTVNLKNSINGNIIHYTLDGSVPDDRSPAFAETLILNDRSSEPNNYSKIKTHADYRKPESSVFKASILRAVVYSEGCPASQPITETYFVNERIHTRYHVPVVSVVADPDDFFSDEEGIYVPGNHNNYYQHGKNWERRIHIEIYDTSGNKVIDQDAGARIHGRGTRGAAQKSLRLYADPEYGNESFGYRFFSDREIDSYKRLILQTTQGDWSDNLFTDLLCHQLVKDLNIDYVSGITTVVFINGEYWGIHNLRERQDESYLKAHYPSTSGDYDILDYALYEGVVPESGDMAAYNSLMEVFADNNIPDDEKFEKVSSLIDVGSLIDYFIAEIYLGNVDFPGLNQSLWRDRENNSPWRWFFFDCDACFFRVNFAHLIEYYNEVELFDNPNDWAMVILSQMLKNRTFADMFYQRFYRVIDEVFSPPRVISKIDSLKDLYYPLMAEHIERWHHPGDINIWLNKIENLKQFAVLRPAEMSSQLLNCYGSPVHIFPNPATGPFIIESDMLLNNEADVKIYDSSGRLVYSKVFDDGSTQIQIDPEIRLTGGLYLIRISTGYFTSSHTMIINYENNE